MQKGVDDAVHQECYVDPVVAWASSFFFLMLSAGLDCLGGSLHPVLFGWELDTTKFVFLIMGIVAVMNKIKYVINSGMMGWRKWACKTICGIVEGMRSSRLAVRSRDTMQDLKVKTRKGESWACDVGIRPRLQDWQIFDPNQGKFSAVRENIKG